MPETVASVLCKFMGGNYSGGELVGEKEMEGRYFQGGLRRARRKRGNFMDRQAIEILNTRQNCCLEKMAL